MGLGMSGWALRAHPVTPPAGTLPLGRLGLAAVNKTPVMRSFPFDALASSLAQGHTCPCAGLRPFPRKATSHNGLLLFPAPGGRSWCAGIRPLVPLAPTPPVSCFNPSFF